MDSWKFDSPCPKYEVEVFSPNLLHEINGRRQKCWECTSTHFLISDKTFGQINPRRQIICPESIQCQSLLPRTYGTLLDRSLRYSYQKILPDLPICLTEYCIMHATQEMFQQNVNLYMQRRKVLQRPHSGGLVQ